MAKTKTIDTPTNLDLTNAISLEREGETDAYYIFKGGGTFMAKTRKGEDKTKATVCGGYGSIYIAKEYAGTVQKFLLVAVKG